MHKAIVDVEIGFHQFEFAIKLLRYIEDNKIEPTDFDTNHLVLLSTANLLFPSGKFQSQSALREATSRNVLIVFAATTLVLDQAFEAIGIKPNFRSTDEAGKLRFLVYMVRCCYAHGIADQHWNVTNKKAGVLTVNVEGQTIKLDLPRLHGQAFDVSQIGGYENWCRIYRAVQRILSDRSGS